MKDDYSLFVERIKEKTGINLDYYKEKQMKRRLTSLREKRGYFTFESYLEALNKDEELLYEMLDRMTINVSEFYRNFKRWEIFEHEVLPKIIQGRSSIKVWSAACSTGEEPYTIAMILNDYFDLNNISILATDIDEQAIQRAKLGIYPERSLKEVPKDKINHYFKKQDSMYHVSDDIKQIVSFKKHNLLADRYEQQFDLIVCRNVLIYFTEEAKQKVYQNFNQALNPNGVLFVGSTEQLFNPQTYGFQLLSTFFYQKMY